MPDFLKRARGVDEDSEEEEVWGRGNFKQMLKKKTIAKKESSNAQPSSSLAITKKITGLRNIKRKEESMGIKSLKELRGLEEAAAIYIQKMVKGFFTKKWYLTCLVRQRLGVPFSGLEFIEHAFL